MSGKLIPECSQNVRFVMSSCIVVSEICAYASEMARNNALKAYKSVSGGRWRNWRSYGIAARRERVPGATCGK